MNQIKVITPENVEIEYTLSGLASRACAALIDIIIVLCFSILIWLSVLLISINMDEVWEMYFGWIIGVAIMLTFIIAYGYFIFMDMTKNGQSIGKRILGLRTIRKNGQPITLKHSAIRNIIRIFIDMFGVGLVVMFANKDMKRLGDLAASTIVVIEKDGKRPMELDLSSMSSKFLAHTTIEEKELLRSYYQRKKDIQNHEDINQSLQQYFTKKFKALGLLKVVEADLKKLSNIELR